MVGWVVKSGEGTLMYAHDESAYAIAEFFRLVADSHYPRSALPYELGTITLEYRPEEG